MNLTTHDWAAFWTVSVGCHADIKRLTEECPLVHGLFLASVSMAEAPSIECSKELSLMFLDAYRHLIDEHGYSASGIKSVAHPAYLRVLPGYVKVAKEVAAVL